MRLPPELLDVPTGQDLHFPACSKYPAAQTQTNWVASSRTSPSDASQVAPGTTRRTPSDCGAACWRLARKERSTREVGVLAVPSRTNRRPTPVLLNRRVTRYTPLALRSCDTVASARSVGSAMVPVACMRELRNLLRASGSSCTSRASKTSPLEGRSHVRCCLESASTTVNTYVPSDDTTLGGN